MVYTFIHPTKTGGTAVERFFKEHFKQDIKEDGHNYVCKNNNNPIIIIRDPIERLKLAILYRKQSLAEEISEIENEVNTKISEAIKFAKSSAFPPSKNLLDFVYSNGAF